MSEERRLVTVLFADVMGSTGLGESLDPEDLRALMGRYFVLAKEVIAARGGTVEKFIGDAVMAVFGLPRAHGDDPARALDAALELRDRVRGDPLLGERLPIRLGVNTGEVVASSAATADGDFLITGDTVNVAARLQQLAEPWSIVAGARTVRASGGGFEFGPSVELETRGRGLAVPASVLLGRAARTPIRRTRLVGRDADMDQLDLVGRRVARERRPFLVSVIAPPGTGKSRLLEEFLDTIDEVMPGATIATAQCLPYGQRITYWPMRALLFRLLDLAEDARPDEVRRATAAWLADLGDPAAAAHAELLAATVGAGDAELADQASVFAAWRSAFELAAQRHPLVLVVEDLHWSSDSLLDLVESLLQPRADVPLLMLVLTRPELLDRRPTWGGGRRNHVSIGLEPLDEGSLELLVNDLLEAPAPEIVRAVVARSDGNPFYAGEIVRSIVENAGRLDDPAAVAAAVAILPDTVQGTVLARLDLLDGAARRVLQVGAVLGRSFRPAGIAAVEPGLADAVAEALVGLVERDLIRPSGADGYVFRHILIREVAYGTLPRAERANLHAAAGSWLETSAADRAEALAELIAYHFREAATLDGALGREPSPVLRAKAVDWLVRAAEAAIAATAGLEATRHLEAAIVLSEAERLPELWERLGDCRVSGGDAVDAYATALRLARERGRPIDDQLRLVASELAVLTRWNGSVRAGFTDQAAALVADGERLLGAASDDRARAMFLIARASLPMAGARSGEVADQAMLDRSRASAAEGRAIARLLDDPRLESAALDAMSVAALQEDDYHGSLAAVETRLSFADRLDFVERLDALTMRAWHRTTLGDIESALHEAQEAIARIGPGLAHGFRIGLGAWETTILHVLGRWDEAASAFARLEIAWEEAGRPSAGYAAHGFLATLDVARARRDDALIDRARRGFESIADEMGEDARLSGLRAFVTLDLAAIERDVVAHFRRSRGRLDHLDRVIAACSDRGHLMAESTLRELLDYLEPRGVRLVAAQTRRALGLRTGEPAELRLALEEFERMNARPYVARVKTELGALVGDRALRGAGERELETLGDIDQLERVTRQFDRAPASHGL